MFATYTKSQSLVLIELSDRGEDLYIDGDVFQVTFVRIGGGGVYRRCRIVDRGRLRSDHCRGDHR